MSVAGAAPAVEAHGLGKRYGDVDALRAVDLSIARGAIYGVLGSNGAGKTTLMKCLGLVARPTSGTLSVLGRDARDRAPELRRRIGYMPQAPALYQELPARSNIEFFGRGAPRARVDRLLEVLDLGRRARDPVRALSGGMKQRVSLASALAHEPELVLLDEPTAGVDPVLRIAFWTEFRRLRDGGQTLIVSTHQLDEAVHCDRLLVLRGGRVLVECTPDELLARGGATATARTAGGETVEKRFAEPRHELPRWLAGLGELKELDVRYDTLEDILVTLIQKQSDA